MKRIISACTLLFLCGLQYELGWGDDLLIARSVDYPHPAWVALDATVTETERHDRWSVLSVKEKKGMQGPGAITRFFACVCVAMARERGFPYLAFLELQARDPSSDQEQGNGCVMVTFLTSQDEDIRDIVGDAYYNTKPGRRGQIVSVDFFDNFLRCPTFRRE